MFFTEQFIFIMNAASCSFQQISDRFNPWDRISFFLHFSISPTFCTWDEHVNKYLLLCPIQVMENLPACQLGEPWQSQLEEALLLLPQLRPLLRVSDSGDFVSGNSLKAESTFQGFSTSAVRVNWTVTFPLDSQTHLLFVCLRIGLALELRIRDLVV